MKTIINAHNFSLTQIDEVSPIFINQFKRGIGMLWSTTKENGVFVDQDGDYWTPVKNDHDGSDNLIRWRNKELIASQFNGSGFSSGAFLADLNDIEI